MSQQSSALRVKLFLDGADLASMRDAYQDGLVQGFTTNPTLMRKSGITDYEGFARSVIAEIPDLPISFEVFSDDFDQMEREARAIASWGGLTYVKVPITNTRGDSALPLVQRLSADGLRVNVTAILTLEQVRATAAVLDPSTPSIVSVFAGRIADTGVDPVPLMSAAAEILAGNRTAELLWASPRELLNLFQAGDCGCHILTATADVIKKLQLVGKDLEQYSLETVQMFYKDAQEAGFKIV